MSDEVAEAVTDATPPTDDAVVEAAPEAPSVIEVPLEGDTPIRIGDWEGPADNFRKQWIPQSGLQEMREKDKAALARQVEQAQNQARQEAALEYQQKLVQLQQQVQQPAQPQSTPTTLEALREQVRTQHGGYWHDDAMSKAFGMFQAELQTRDQQFQQVVQYLEKTLGDYSEKMKVLDSLSNNHASTQWGSFVDELAEEFGSKVPRSTIEKIAQGYQVQDGDTADDLRAGIKAEVQAEADAIAKFFRDMQKNETDRNDKARKAGIPGSGGKAAPSKKAKPMSLDEIVDHFGEFGSRPS